MPTSRFRPRNRLKPQKATGLKVGDQVRYKPGVGTYGYEESLGDDGRIPGVITGFTPTRVQVDLTVLRGGVAGVQHATVDAASLVVPRKGEQ